MKNIQKIFNSPPSSIAIKGILFLSCILLLATGASADTYTFKSVQYNNLLNVGTVSIKEDSIKREYKGIQTADFTVGLKSEDGLESVRAFCVDPTQFAAVGGNVNLPVDLVTPSAVNGGLQAAWLFEYASKDPGLYTSTDKVAALQLAIWEVIVEDEENIVNYAYNLDADDFKVVSNKTAAYAGAKTLLTKLGANFATADLAYLNSHYAIAKNPYKQDFILQGVNVAPTPEPSTALLVLLGVGLMGTGTLGRGIRRRIRDNDPK